MTSIHKKLNELMTYFESSVIWNHNGRVESQYEDDPVPDGFEQTVVQNDVRWRLWGL